MSALTFTRYQHTADSFRNQDLSYRETLSMLTMGMAGEAGETTDLIKKYLYHGHELDPAILAKELGDQLWYISVLAKVFYLDLGDIASGNIEKLTKRYGSKFSTERSINRED